jgi:acyl-CoA thioester hydrolase
MSSDPETYRGFVYPWEMDHVGHLNVQFYVRRFDEASWHFLARLGVTPTYLREHRRGVVAREQRATYHAEVLAGSLLVIRTRLAEVREKSMRYTHTMYNLKDAHADEVGATMEEVAATMELVVIHIDAVRRKSCAWPGDVFARGARLLSEQTPE